MPSCGDQAGTLASSQLQERGLSMRMSLQIIARDSLQRQGMPGMHRHAQSLQQSVQNITDVTALPGHTHAFSSRHRAVRGHSGQASCTPGRCS